ncbi:MAG: oxygenase MpaB family protein [Solirubrobacterales bacterium]
MSDAMTEPDRYFTPDDVIWRVSREMALMLGGGRALLMQAAHPLVVAGVDQHSNYRSGPWGRLERTMEAVWTIVYGTRGDADRTTARVRAMHRRVNGTIAEDMGPFPAGTRYDATDPDLLMWVHATLIDTAMLVYTSWVGPLSEDEQWSYYEDVKVTARMFGVTDEVMPADLGEFRTWMDERLASDEICVTPVARRTIEVVLHPSVPLALRPVLETLNLVTASLLPEKLREGYGLGWDPARAALLTASRQWVKRVALPLMPDLIRAVGAAREAEGRRTLPLRWLIPISEG